MLSEADIRKRLRDIGVAESEVPNVMRDVVQVILAKVTTQFLEMLPEQERLHLRSLNPSEYQDYITENAATLPHPSQKQFDTIHDETWEDYFKSVA